MAESKWQTWEMAAVNSKLLTHLFQLLNQRGLISKDDVSDLCDHLVNSLESGGGEGPAQYAKVITGDIKQSMK